MEKSAVRTMRLGIFVLVSTVVFTVAIYLVGQKKDLFSNTFYLRIRFNNINGLQPGNNVRLSGINVGSVASVVIQNDSTIEVRIRVRNNTRPFIKKNTVASVGTDGLMGNMLINLSPSRGASMMVQDNDLIQSYGPVKTEDLLKTLNVTNENAALLTADLLEITRQIKHGQGTVSYLLSDTLLRQKVKATMTNLESTTRQTSLLTAHLQHISEDLDQGKGLAGWLLRDSITAGQIGKTIADLQNSARQIHRTTDSLNSFVGKIGQGKGPLSALFYDTAMTRNLHQTLQNLNVGTARFSEDMEALKRNMFFRRYFKEKEKQKGRNPSARTP